MPRPRNHAKHVALAVGGLLAAVTAVVVAVRAAAASRDGVDPARKKNSKYGAAVKATWARYTPRQRKERIAKMLKGRGLKPKGEKAARPGKHQVSPGRARQIAAMKAYWAAKRKAGK